MKHHFFLCLFYLLLFCFSFVDMELKSPISGSTVGEIERSTKKDMTFAREAHITWRKSKLHLTDKATINIIFTTLR